MIFRLEFVICLERREECGLPFRYPAFTPPDPVAPALGNYQIRAGITHLQIVAAWFQVRAGIETKTSAAIANTSRQ